MTISSTANSVFRAWLARVRNCAMPLLLFATLSLGGCGGGNVARPTGQVVDGGAPVERAGITFSGQADGREIRVSGLTDAEGRYRLDYGVHDGLPIGPVKVTIARALLRDGTPLPPGEEGRSLLETGKAKMRTYEFAEELTPGSPRLDFDLANGDGSPPR